MNWAWTTWLDEAWRAPAFPVWITLVVAGVAAFVVLGALLRAEASAANGALAVIALLAIGVAAVLALRGADGAPDLVASEGRMPQPMAPAVPALACLDELAGDTVQTACERVLFGSPDHAAAAVSYVAAQVARLGMLDAATPEAATLRNALQRDRYGLTAHLLTVRDGCTPVACAAFRSFTDTSRIVANMTARTYDAVVGRHMLAWTTPAPAVPLGAGAASDDAASGLVAPVAGLPPSVPTGRPTTIDYPTSDSIPPVSIMSGEPAAAAAAPPSAPVARPPAPQPRPTPSAAKRSSKSAPAAPVQLAPAPPSGDNR